MHSLSVFGSALHFPFSFHFEYFGETFITFNYLKLPPILFFPAIWKLRAFCMCHFSVITPHNKTSLRQLVDFFFAFCSVDLLITKKKPHTIAQTNRPCAASNNLATAHTHHDDNNEWLHALATEFLAEYGFSFCLFFIVAITYLFRLSVCAQIWAHETTLCLHILREWKTVEIMTYFKRISRLRYI